MHFTRRRVLQGAAGAAVLAAGGPAFAQAGDVARVIVGFPPGGPPTP